MAKILGPDFIALQVRDLDAAKRFYMEVLGLTPAPQSPPDAVVFDTSPIPFAVRTPLVVLDDVSRLGWGVSLWLRCDDADALYMQLEKAGVTITQRPQAGPFGRQFAFTDPDGYPITVHEG